MYQTLKPIFEFEEHTPRLNEKFAAYLDGKSAAIVGRSCIHDLEQGKFIDSHDVVVRVHQAVPYNLGDSTHIENRTNELNNPVKIGQFVPEEWHPIVGKRVNICYPKLRHKTFNDDRNGYIRAWSKVFRDSGGKFVCRDIMTNQNHHQHAYMLPYVKLRYPSWELRDAITLRIGERVESGTLAIADILSHNIKQAYITGFPCGFDLEIFPDLPEPAEAPQPGNLKFLCDLCELERVTCDNRMNFLFKRHFGSN